MLVDDTCRNERWDGLTGQGGIGRGAGHGFVDIEFWIFVALAGIFVAVAIPAWQDYRGKSRVEQALVLALPAQVAVQKAFAVRGPADMAQPASTGWAPPAPIVGVKSVDISRGGVITIRFTADVDRDGAQLQIVPVAAGKALDLSDPASKGTAFQWECGGAAGKSDLRRSFLPQSCRGQGAARGGNDRAWWEWAGLLSSVVVLGFFVVLFLSGLWYYCLRPIGRGVLRRVTAMRARGGSRSHE